MSNDPILAVADSRRPPRRRGARRRGARPQAPAGACEGPRATSSSNADAEAENAMIATLRAAFPEHAIVGKEAGEIVSQIAGGSRAGKNTLKWIVDPLDGTVNFRHGFPYYAVSIALTHGNEVTHAVVLDPVHDELFTAIKGKGAQLNGTPIRDLDLRAPRGGAGRHRVSGARQPRHGRLPAGAERARSEVRRHSPRRRLRARPRVRRGGSPRRLLGDRPQCRGMSRPARCSSSKPEAASATSPAAAISCARTK